MNRVRVVLDTLGGDNPPAELIRGGLAAAEAFGVEVVFAGEQGLIEREIRGHRLPLSVIHAPEAVKMEDPPAEAVRRKKNSSLVQGILALKEGRAEAFVSPGNTGAVMAASLLHLGRIPGIERPGIAVSVPTTGAANFLLIDSGANVDCSPHNLKQFAIMGRIYMQEILGLPQPRIGLLNIGAEEGKGNALVRKAFDLLKEVEGFVGNVESNRLLQGGVDVVVCDGFSGNILLKGVEGSAAAVIGLLKKSIHESLRARVGALLLAPQFQWLKEKLDASYHGGAPLLGLKNVVIIAHGHSDALAIKNAIKVANSAVQSRLPEKIEQGIARFNGTPLFQASGEG
ncbi:MAG: phosphate acyltransferase PlsX [Candidatus Acetothermia bacterium]|jgi:glycerol-3-phosphate acyltransferase PlsX|nr:phosphate acyltransferase PlsX [Candidatus Acetothermia bacterium]MDH7505783.1 phosphate acyltransferase PlsX [Candidatus Acetothermia bacterium]